MNKIYPSSVTPVFGQTTNSFNKSCPRFFAMSSLVSEDVEIDPLYQAVGRLAEERIYRKFDTDKRPEIEYLKEMRVQYELAPGWMLSGRVDVLERNLKDPKQNCVWEIKGSTSQYMRAEIIKEGKPNVNHIGQLITYMVVLGIPNGMYSFSYIHFNRRLSELRFETREFSVALRGDGIYLDGERWGQHTVNDYMKFFPLMIDARDGAQLPAKSMNVRACESCPFNIVCATNPQTKEEFANQFQDLGAREVKSFGPPQVKVHDTNRRK